MIGQHSRLINLVLHHDWTRTKTAMYRLLNLESRTNPIQFGDADHYELGSLGTISKHRPSKNWYRFSGPAITATIPWLSTMLDTMRELNPDDGAISYLRGNGASHVDLAHLRTALNYVFDNSDEQAFTWIQSDSNRETYASDVGQAWLLNTQLPHGITNNGERWTLSIHFNADYDRVATWFDKRPGLEFGHDNKEKR